MRSLSNEIVIEANEKGRINWRELWLHRELFYFFAWRDIKVRYKQTALGAGWAILQPVLATGVFTLFFNRVAKISSGSASIPYPVFAYVGLMYWNVFANGVGTIANSVVGSSGVMSKIYFPRLIPPLSASALSVVDFFFAAIVFVLLMVGFGVVPHPWGILLFLPSLVLLVVASLGLGIFFAALNVKYRDVRSALPFIIQLLFFTTPIIYPITLIPHRFQIFAYLNPGCGAISSVKAGLFGQPINFAGLLLSWISALVLFYIGLWYFKRKEKTFVDVI